jgi:DNA-binding GntR family transcriptional regulator
MHSVGDLSEELGVSRTPVREALIELASRGMVRFERNRGVRILQTSVSDLEEIFELRMLLEVPATHKAIERMDMDAERALAAEVVAMAKAAKAGDESSLWIHDRRFHHRLILEAGNQRLADYVDALRDMVLVRGVTTAGRTRSLDEITDEHRVIMESVTTRNADASAEAMRTHIEHTRRLLIAQELEGLEGRRPA